MLIGSKELIRDINNNLVLETIIHKSPISRATLSKELGLTKATISTIVQDLLDKELVIEIGSDNTELGRKPILLTFHKDAGYALSIDIGVKHCRALLSNLCAEILYDESFRTPKEVSDLPSTLISTIEQLLKQLPPSKYGLIGITLSIHGVTHEKEIVFVPYYDLSTLSLVEKLEEHFSLPIYIENEANLSALGEHSFVYNHSNIASVNVHSGLGLGLIMDNRLVKGYQGFSGEIGHTIVDMDGRPCPCGNRGCLEQYVSESALLEELASSKGCEELSFSDFRRLYEQRDSMAMETSSRFVKYMTVALNNILNIYNPEIVIINSQFTTYYPELVTEIIESLTSRMNNFSQIVPSTLQDKSSLLGGLCIAIRHFLGVKYLRLENLNHTYDGEKKEETDTRTS